ncbi:MAG: response regulator [Synergistaceae bacterium]|jgi:PleD family two-component response regulator|nr:response regulator [Synergistaceae bacterium]
MTETTEGKTGEKKKKVILALDDAPANLQIIQNTLKDEFDIRLAKSVQMAVTALSRSVPDLLLLDVAMPEMSGFEFVKMLRANPRWEGIPVLFVSSCASEDFAAQADFQGAKGYIVKPFNPESLRNLVRKVFDACPDA